MSVYTLRAIRATPEPTIESFFYSLQEILADLKEKYALFLAAYNACYCGYVTPCSGIWNLSGIWSEALHCFSYCL